MTTRDDIEAALWQWSEWRADQRRVDAVLSLVDQYGVPVDADAAQRVLAQAHGDAARIRQAARAEAIRLVRTVRDLVEDASKVPA